MNIHSRKRIGGAAAAVLLLCLPVPRADAQDAPYPGAPTIGREDQGFTPYPLIIRPDDAGLAFDLGGSDQRKLQLQITGPIGIRTLNTTHIGGQGATVAGAGLELPIGETLRLGSAARVSQANTDFQAVGSIHCENGTLNAVSYRASNCYFIDAPIVARAHSFGMGARYEANRNVRAGLSLFRAQGHFEAPPGSMPGGNAAVLEPGSLAILPGNPLSSGFSPAAGATRLDAELTGIDLEFQVGISTDQAGDMVLGLQLTRILDSDYQASFFGAPGLQHWTIAEPFDSARLSFDWYKGAFSGGVQTYYREQVDFLGRPSLEPIGTFDVHFTWRAPWNASLSVGASNVLDAGGDEKAAKDHPLADPFESVYGRIPYVRYKQDL